MKHRYPCSSAPSDADTVRELYVEYQPNLKRDTENRCLFFWIAMSFQITQQPSGLHGPSARTPSKSTHRDCKLPQAVVGSFGVHQCMPSLLPQQCRHTGLKAQPSALFRRPQSIQPDPAEGLFP